jgi:predicted ferric reductase
MEIALYILFISMQILVGCYGAYQFTPMGGYHTENKILKYTLPIARAGGRLVTFNCALLLITACKYCWTLIRTYIAPIIPIGFPIDNIMPKYHKTVAYWIIVMGCFTHTIPQIVNYSTKSIILENKFRAWTFGNGFATTQLLITGTLLALIFSTFYITTLPFFRKTAAGFRWFWFFHMGGVATAYPLLILHGTCRGHPIFLYIQLLPLLLYLFDISMRKSKTKTTNVLEWTCHEDNGEHITELVIECPSNFNYTPGQYCELKFSPISANEWHPFTIASAPTDDDDIDDLDNDIEAGISSPTKKKLVFYIKSAGRWTEALHNYASAFDLNKAMKPTEISIRGPHGAPAMNYFEYRHIIVIGSGIGVTPLISIWKYLIHKAATRTTTQSESRTSTLTQNGSSSIELGKSLEGSILTFDTSLSSSELLSKDEEVYNDELLNNEQQQQKTMLRKVSINIEKILESMTVSMFLLCFFVMGETIAIVMQMFKFSAFANLFGSFLSITALLIHGCNIIVSTIVLGPCIYIRLFKFWLELCIIIVDSFALWISMIGYMYYNPTNDYNSSNHISRATNTTYFYFFGVVVVLHAIRIFHIFYTTLKPTKDNNTTVTTTTTTTTTTNNHNGNQICSIQGILINKYYSGMRFAAKSLIPPIGSKLFSMEFYGTREKPKDDDDNEDSDSDSESEEIITDLMGSSEFKRISLHKKNQNLNLNNNNRKSKIKQDDCLSFKCGRPDWRQIFLKAMAKAHNSNSNSNSNARGSCGESVGVFFCGSPAIAADLQTMAKEVTAQHQFAKKHLDGKACKCKLIVHSENF